MSINAQKTWAVKNLDVFAGKRIQQALQQTGKALPCHVTGFPKAGVPIVTVAFDLTNVPYTLPNITCPLFGPEYIRYPIQVGCKGVAFPADAYLGGVSGLGGGTADLSLIGNLTALVFFPIGNSGWAASEDPNSLVLYGPNGVIIRDANKKTTITLTTNGLVINVQAGKALTINGALIVKGNLQLGGTIESLAGGSPYAGDIKTTGNVVAGQGTADQVGLTTHIHPAPGGNTSPPTPGT